MMPRLQLVVDTPTNWLHLILIRIYLFFGYRVSVVESFVAFHHIERRPAFLPPVILPAIYRLVTSGKISLIRASDIDVNDIYAVVSEKAVKNIDSVFSYIKKKHKHLIGFVRVVLKSHKAESIFRKHLCEELARFYSINILLDKIECYYKGEEVQMHADFDLRSYNFLKKATRLVGNELKEHSKLHFIWSTNFVSICYGLSGYFMLMIKMFVLTGTKIFSSLLLRRTNPHVRKYRIAISIISPVRQLAEHKRCADFIVDGEQIKSCDVVYLPIVSLSSEQKKKIAAMGANHYFLPHKSVNFCPLLIWLKLFVIMFKARHARLAEVSMHAIYDFYRWQHAMKNVTFDHYLTHVDSSPYHIARNIILKRNNVETWYFTDSINFGFYLREVTAENLWRHPFLTYLYYDHFVTWSKSIEDFFKSHPTHITKYHVVGCLWADHIRNASQTRNIANKKNTFVGVFDTSYACNTPTSYKEAVQFANDCMQLVYEIADVVLLFKEKKPRTLHATLDPILGQKLKDVYDKMSAHERVRFFSPESDSSEIMAESDMIISFPFTSTTFEAISANKPAVWHDPFNRYSKTLFASCDSVTTHDYVSLRRLVENVAERKKGGQHQKISQNSPLFDPYRDGKAIERFRQLMVMAS